MSKRLLCFLLMLIFSRTMAQDVTTLRINPDDALGGTASEMFDSVRYIPLETRKGIDIGNIRGLQVSRHYFVFCDFDTHGLYIFDKNGQFSAVVKSLPIVGWTENDFMKIAAAYNLDQETEKISIVYEGNGRVKSKYLAVYDSHGKLIENRQLPVCMNGLSNSFGRLSNDEYVFAYNHSDSSLCYRSIKYQFYRVKGFDTIVGGLLPIDITDARLKNKLNIDPSYLNGYNRQSGYALESYWSRIYDFTMTHIAANFAPHFVKFIFPLAISLDTTYIANLDDFNKLQDYIYRESKTQINEIGEFMFNKQVFSFRLQTGMPLNGSEEYLYGLQSGSLYSWSHITSDSISSFLPLGFQIDAMTDDKLYSTIPAFKINVAMDENFDKNPNYSKTLLSYYAKHNPHSNPFIIEYKLKDGL